MNNINDTQFATALSTLDVRRSRFPRPSKHLTTFNEGELVPIYCDEILPGDTVEMNTKSLLRMQTLLTPIMDDLYIDIYFFFVPNRIVWKHFEEFMGENKNGPWIPATEYSIPQLQTNEKYFFKGSIADHFGLPTNIENISVNALPFRAYAKIVDDWFISENLQEHPNLFFEDANIDTMSKEEYDELGGDFYIESCIRGGTCFNVGRYHDYFSSALPAPQKGPDVMLPLGDKAPLNSGDIDFMLSHTYDNPIRFKTDAPFNYQGVFRLGLAADQGNNFGKMMVDKIYASGEYNNILGSSLYVDLSQATGASVNQLRLAFQLQKFYELMARGGSRYTEIIKSCFGVSSPDARLQRSEFLGGDRCLINVQQVVQTSASEHGTTPKGSISAYSLTFTNNAHFIKSFTEHGFILGLACVRHKHSYQQGINKMFSRRNKFDFYFPQFANIGEQPILNKEIFANGSSSDNEVFGYNEAFADLRYKPNTISGEFRSNYEQSLDYWHLADYYRRPPVLSNEWLQESKNSLDRCLAVTSELADQFLADFYFECNMTRVMPLYSVPGLIDHH